MLSSRPLSCTRARRRTFTLIELLVVMGILCVLIAFLLPALNKARLSALKVKMESERRQLELQAESVPAIKQAAQPVQPTRPTALVTAFEAKIDVTPSLSVGTAEPESIYEAAMDAKLLARAPADGAADTEIQLPLPPQIISLAGLSMSIDGTESDSVAVVQDKLVWHGQLPRTPTPVSVKYSAVGRGLYTLQTPPGAIIDRFKIDLTANGSDVRMLDLSLQPTSFQHLSDRTTYAWDYKRLMFGRPISLDVLGISPVDRLGELSWLGPISVVAFGIVIGLMSRAFHVGNFDRWMLILVLGTFTGAYPLMYFAQQFIPLHWAMAGAGVLVMTIIAARMISIMGVRLGLFGVAIPAAMIMTLTLDAAIHPQMQGILLTGLSLGLFILAMMLAPRFRAVALPPAMQHA